MVYQKKVLGFLTAPAKAFRAERKTSVQEAFKYVLVLSLVLAVLSGAYAAFIGGPVAGAVGGIAAYLGSVIGLVISGLWVHLWVYFLGGKKGLHETMKTIFFAETPGFLLGWIPYVNIVAIVWMIVLDVIGLKVLQNMPTGRAAAAIIIAIAIPLLLMTALILAVASFAGISPWTFVAPGQF
jgi:hypothetical protein